MINWEAVGAIVELAGAVAVIATLFYLAGPLKQNTKATRFIPMWGALGLLVNNDEFSREVERIRRETTDR